MKTFVSVKVCLSEKYFIIYVEVNLILRLKCNELHLLIAMVYFALSIMCKHHKSGFWKNIILEVFIKNLSQELSPF